MLVTQRGLDLVKAALREQLTRTPTHTVAVFPMDKP